VPSTLTSSDFGPLTDPDPLVRVPAAPNQVPRERGGGSSRLVGTLVHRLLEHREPGADDLARLASGMLRASERASLEDPEQLAADVVDRFRAVTARPWLTALMQAGACFHEVPFVLRRSEGLVHGTIDSLVHAGDQVTVVEFKTGAAAGAHRAQLQTYLEAAASLFPAARVRGVLVYPGEEVWIDGEAGAG
jgi:ATP-dependent exoDNAse (exonuclease V) beta subunit